mmetsp:Transcript_43739/g.85423  ORF Transcript_43739/g.85423 Transcript_43739/m.85423 type:complete len:200 (+) Transcript_43739:665-1264(+)
MHRAEGEVRHLHRRQGNHMGPPVVGRRRHLVHDDREAQLPRHRQGQALGHPGDAGREDLQVQQVWTYAASRSALCGYRQGSLHQPGIEEGPQDAHRGAAGRGQHQVHSAPRLQHQGALAPHRHVLGQAVGRSQGVRGAAWMPEKPPDGVGAGHGGEVVVRGRFRGRLQVAALGGPQEGEWDGRGAHEQVPRLGCHCSLS